MKKFLVVLLAFGLIFSFAACGVDETSKDESSSSKVSADAKGDESSEAAESEESKTTSDTSSKDETSNETSDVPEKVSFTNKFVSWGGDVTVKVNATQSTSLRLTKIDEAPVKGDVVLFTNDYGKTIAAGSETYADYAILVCTYDHKIFSYSKTSLKLVGEDSAKATTKIPADGFVVAVHKDQKTEISHLTNIKDDNKFFVHGIQIGDVSISLTKATKAPIIDGNVSKSEYGKAKWIVNEHNKSWDYSQFKGQFYATAEVYSTYDAKNLYIGVIVDSPYHHCPIGQDKAEGMYSYECIQLNVSSLDPLGEYISQHFDYAIDDKSRKEGVVRQYGFAANDEGETLSYVWMGVDKKFTGNALCKRDDVNEKTYYEVAIPWTELGSTTHPFDILKAEKIGFAISVNSSNEDSENWKNIKMRDGGGIIGRNDFSKMASVTLK